MCICQFTVKSDKKKCRAMVIENVTIGVGGGAQSHTANMLKSQNGNTEHSNAKSMTLTTMLRLLNGSANVRFCRD